MNIAENKILFTGGNGRLGKACKKVLPTALYPTRQELDVTSPEKISRYVEIHRPQVVVHLAAMAGIPQCEKDRAAAYQVNVKGTLDLAEISAKNGVEFFIFLSTACVFPGTRADKLPDEDTLPYPKHYYGWTKYLAEEKLLTLSTPQMQKMVVRTNFTSMPWEYPKAFTDRFGTYLFGQGVATGLRDVIHERPRRPIIHICGNRVISMYEYAKLGGSSVAPMTLADYQGPPLTVDMSMTSKYWKTYRLEDHSFDDN